MWRLKTGTKVARTAIKCLIDSGVVKILHALKNSVRREPHVNFPSKQQNKLVILVPLMLGSHCKFLSIESENHRQKA